MDIGKIIADERGKLNLSQRALAQKSGIRQATLSSIEQGGDVKLATARNILIALGLDFGVVSVVAEKKSMAEQRDAEIKRVSAHFLKRRSALKSLLDGLSATQIRHVRQVNQATNTGYLAELWDAFLMLDKPSMRRALDDQRFRGMAWQSLLQANPFIVAKVGDWQ
jgi:transcriptional regulator with XRE-family HTH domain